MSIISKNIKYYGVICIAIVLGLMTMTSCHQAKQVAYFQNIPDSAGTEVRIKNTPYVEPLIHVGDILNIQITTIDAKIGGIISNESQTNTEGAGGSEPTSGYIVDKNGYIEMPVVGRLKVAGLTTSEAKERIRETALKFYKDPLVNVRVANFVISVLGEVRNPGRYVIATEKINIIDAIALAGDLSLGGKRGNVMLIREENGESVFTRIDMNRTDLFTSEYFYVQSGDKIYVEPLRTVARSGTADKAAERVLTVTLSMISLTVAILGLVVRVNAAN
ncbi:MAG: polysaccharide biosynthesis/export family protein [Chitinophagales bacterium]|nr:polysaccharide biosynthesis/export family protein [Chitinophagaceae bacterium]MCB9065379.1 polysaccharide biosynthesis/export family protein [Chitinophagales bacterium]